MSDEGDRNMTKKVSFTAMEHGAQADYDLIMAEGESKTAAIQNPTAITTTSTATAMAIGRESNGEVTPSQGGHGSAILIGMTILSIGTPPA